MRTGIAIRVTDGMVRGEEEREQEKSWKWRREHLSNAKEKADSLIV